MMKKMLSLLLVIVLCLSVSTTVLAADNYVPSIGDKQEPEIEPENGHIAFIEESSTGNTVDTIDENDGCLIVTSVATAQAGTNNIPEDSKNTLLDVYQKLLDGSMKLPYDQLGKDPSNMEIRDLFDISLICQEHSQLLEQEGHTLRVTFDLGVKANEKVYAMVYVDGQWKKVRSCQNNGDGTVTVKMDEICPLVFCVEAKTPPAQTGDDNRNTLAVYGALLGCSAAALVGLVVVYRKKASKQ